MFERAGYRVMDSMVMSHATAKDEVTNAVNEKLHRRRYATQKTWKNFELMDGTYHMKKS